MREVEEKLEEIIRAIRAIERGRVEPVAYARKEAALALGFSVKKLNRLVAAGVIPVCDGDDRMIPKTAVDAFARPVFKEQKSRRTSGGRPKSDKYDVREEKRKLAELRAKRER
jgi:hypothetical protein